MTDKFNPYEGEHGPGEKFPEVSVLIPVSEIRDMLTRAELEHSEGYLKKCPYCKNSIIFYKDEWYFCPEHNFIRLDKPVGLT